MSSSSSPLLFIQSNAGSENVCVPSSPTSTVEIHEFGNSTFETKSMSVDCLSSVISEINCASPQSVIVKKNKVAIRTIHNSDIKITKPFHMVLDLKVQLCCDTPLNIADLMIIRNGKELSNCDSLNCEDLKSSKVFVMINTKTKTVVPITLKTQGIEGAQTKTLKLPLNVKVGQLKKDMFFGKMTSVKPESQRIIVGGKVLQDCFIIGDYLLYAMLNKPVTSSASSSSSSPAKYHSTPSGKVVLPLCTMYLSKTTNLKHEVDITFVSGVKGVKHREMKYGVEISKPISLFNTVLHREFHQPLPTETMPYVFYLRVPSVKPSSAVISNTTTKKKVISQTPSYSLVELDQTKTLLDYGLDTSTKTATVEIIKRDLNNPLSYSWDPLVLMLFMNQMMSVYAHGAKLKCEAMGVDLTAVPSVTDTASTQNAVSTTGPSSNGKTILSLMQATNAVSAGSMSDDSDTESGGRSPNSVVNNKKRPTSPRDTERAVSPKRSASAIATHVTTSEKATSSVATTVKKASSGGGLFGNLKAKKGFLSKK